MKGKNRRKCHSRKKICTAALFLCVLLLTGCGDDGESIYNFSGVEPKEIDPWVYLQDTALSSNTQILGFASSASRLGITVGVAGIVFPFCIWRSGFFCPERESQGGNQGGGHDKGNGGNYDFQRPVLAGDF